MQQAGDLPEVTVSETGAVIPAETLRSAGIRPGVASRSRARRAARS